MRNYSGLRSHFPKQRNREFQTKNRETIPKIRDWLRAIREGLFCKAEADFLRGPIQRDVRANERFQRQIFRLRA